MFTDDGYEIDIETCTDKDKQVLVKANRWFIQRLGEFWDIDEIDEIIIDDDDEDEKTVDLYLEWTNSYRCGDWEKENAWMHIPFDIFFSNANEREWVKQWKAERKEEKKLEQQLQRERREKEYQEKRKREYLRLKKEFGGGK